MTWFVERRLEWIKEAIEIYGFINRVHIGRKFGVSTPQAAYDIREARKRWPDLMEYDLPQKRYVRKPANGVR